jgi:hypothetical protein
MKRRWAVMAGLEAERMRMSRFRQHGVQARQRSYLRLI